MGAAGELQRLNGFDDDGEQRRDREQRGSLVERGLVQDELVAVVQPTGLGQKRVERQQRDGPDREGRAAQLSHDQHRRADGEHVRSHQAKARHKLAAASRQR